MTGRYLADTHVLLWAMAGSERLPAGIAAVLTDPDNTVHFSPVSAWEISIKFGLGKLDLGGHTPLHFIDVVAGSGLVLLVPTVTQYASVNELPIRHKDPFDRMLVWQAIQEDITLLSTDSRLAGYRLDGLSLLAK